MNKKASTAKSAKSLILMMLAPNLVFAAAWEVEPSVSAAVRVDDNFTLDDRSARQQQVTSTGFSGSVTISRLTEAVETFGVLRLNAIQYTGDVEETSTQREIADNENIVAFFSTKRRESPLTQWGFDASIKVDTLLRAVNVFVDPEDTTIEPDDDVDDGLTRVAIDRQRFIFKPFIGTRLSERSRLRFNYRFNELTYDNLQGQDLVDFSDHTIAGVYSYKYTPSDDLSLRARYKQFSTEDDEREYESYSLTGGWGHRFTETTSMGTSLGFRETKAETDSGDDDTSGVLLRVTGRKSTGLTRFEGRIGRNLFSSGSGDLVQADEYVFNVTRTLSPLLSFSLKSRLFQNRLLRDDDDDADRADRRYFSVRPSLTWNFAQWWRMVATYDYRREKRDGEPESAVSNSILISVVYSQPTSLSGE
ncbi:MAG: hypothetical protein AAF434_07785 [Pseudomonadota bacterium]